MASSSLTYDWNDAVGGVFRGIDAELHDETLRDGLQSPSVRDPSLEDKRRIVDLLAQLDVASACIGLPGAAPRSYRDTDALVAHCERQGHGLLLCAAARTRVEDIEPIVEIASRHGRRLEAMMFLGSSPIRTQTEGWPLSAQETRTRTAVKAAKAGGLSAGFVTEDTTRTPPETLRVLFEAAVDEGVDRLVLCDTCGEATPDGVGKLVAWTAGLLKTWGVRDRVKIDWHGHDDRGLSLVNAMRAATAGADRIHGTILGVGERVGNSSLDHLLVNRCLLRGEQEPLPALRQLVELVSQATGVPIPSTYPVFGEDAFRTATGVHAAAIRKAMAAGRPELADRVYSSVPAALVGREQAIEIGHMSGRSNVLYWLERRGLTADDAQVAAVLREAKASSSLLTEPQILAALHGGEE